MQLPLITKVRRLYFVGIGGIGMSGIARLAKQMDYVVSGSDMSESQTTRELRSCDIKVYIGHAAENLRNEDVVVSSSAISPANPEIIAARSMGIPVIQRAEMLAELMRLRFGIAVAGTHGKTTTTSYIAAVLEKANLSPTSVIGGRWFGIDSNANLGKGKVLICEADESDGSFLKLSPIITVVTNIDFDHMDYFGTEEKQLEYFLRFINKTPFYGKAVLCVDDESVGHLRKQVEKPYLTYGIDSREADLRAENLQLNNGKMHFDVSFKKEPLGRFGLAMMGRHNVLNALAAIGVGIELGISKENIQNALGSFLGIARRMSFVGRWNRFRVFDDYGHHPTEVRLTTEAVAHQLDRSKGEELICVFQPHRYTRTLSHFEAFAESFGAVDTLYLTDIFAAHEQPIEGVSTLLIYERVRKPKQVHYMRTWREVLASIRKRHSKGVGIVLTIGAGDIYQLAKQLARPTKKPHKPHKPHETATTT